MTFKQEKQFLTLEQKKIILKEREKNKTLNEIVVAVFREYQTKTSKSEIHRVLKKKKKFLLESKSYDHCNNKKSVQNVVKQFTH